jgi:ribonuclease-3
MIETIEKLAKKIGVEFRDITTLRTACTHRSFLNENKGAGLEHNERLEFLGDAVLELVVTSYLFRKYPKKQEGELTAFRSAIVNTMSLIKVAEHLGLNQFILLSKGEAKDTGRARSIILANAVEAVIGAIYMDQGYNAAANFISERVLEVIDIEEIISKKLWIDAKSRFQEKAQENEKYVMDAIKEVSKGKTTIIIAHRLSTVKDADQIIVMDKGRIG